MTTKWLTPCTSMIQLETMVCAACVPDCVFAPLAMMSPYAPSAIVSNAPSFQVPVAFVKS
ncbi:hypothetical protein D3C86_1722800 [compost metagenome]